MLPITSEDMERFHENAMAALARRGRGYMVEEVLSGLQTAFLGALPIIGMLFWKWSGIEMFVFLMVSLWCGIGCDVTKFFWLQKRARAFADARFNDWHVWRVADALRAGRDTMPTRNFRAQWQPWNGVFCDIVIGLFSTVLILALLVGEAQVDFRAVANRGVALALTLMVALRVFHTVWEIRYHREADAARGYVVVLAADRPVKAAVGLRGAALLMLMFLVAFLVEEMKGDADRIWIIVMSVVNGLAVLYGLLNAIGWVFLRSETRWLREYMERQHKEDASLEIPLFPD
jgi:hypothetical protein